MSITEKKIYVPFCYQISKNFEKYETSAIDILPRKAQFQSSGLHICAALPASALILKHLWRMQEIAYFLPKQD